MTDQSNETWLNPQDACKRLGVSRATLERYVNLGHIHKYRRGLRTVLFKQSELDRFLEIRPGAGAMEVATNPPIEGMEVATHDALSPRECRVLEMVQAQCGQNEIIEEIWHVNNKQGRAYMSAAAEYRAIVAKLLGKVRG